MDSKIERILYRPYEAFEMLGINRSTGYRLIKLGELPSIRVGNTIRIPADELREWLRRKLEEARPAPNQPQDNQPEENH
jgi:excisionase family DNA binding protein